MKKIKLKCYEFLGQWLIFQQDYYYGDIIPIKKPGPLLITSLGSAAVLFLYIAFISSIYASLVEVLFKTFLFTPFLYFIFTTSLVVMLKTYKYVIYIVVRTHDKLVDHINNTLKDLRK